MKSFLETSSRSEESTSPKGHYYSTPSIQPSPMSSAAISSFNFYDILARHERGSWNTNNYACVAVNRQGSNKTDVSQKLKHYSQSQPENSSGLELTNQVPTATCSTISPKSELTSPSIHDVNAKDPLKEITDVLSQDAKKMVVRPIAFRPVVPTKRTGSSPTERSSFTPVSYDDGYGSRDTSRGSSNTMSTMSTISRDSDTYYASPIQTDTQRSFRVIPIQNKHGLSNLATETLIQEKDAEIGKLRRTMELNESAIIRVHEQKRIEWENQMKELAQEYHRRLRIQHDESQDHHSELRQVVAKLEIDNRQLSVDVQQNQVDKDRQEQLTTQMQELRQRNADLTKKLNNETCECDVLRQRNKDLEAKTRALQERLTVGTMEQERLKSRIAETEGAKSGNERAQNIRLHQLNQRAEQQELNIQHERQNFQHEQQKWQEEKEKVLQYQKHLQRTYVQMYRRNNELEQQLCRINSRRKGQMESNPQNTNNTDRNSFLHVDLEKGPESFC